MEYSNGGDMAPLVGKERAKPLPEVEEGVKGCVQSVDGIRKLNPKFGEVVKTIESVDGKKLSGRERVVKTSFLKEFNPTKDVKVIPTSPDWLHKLLPISPEESGYRHNHYNLSKKISELCEKIRGLEGTVKILRAMTSDLDFNFHKKLVKEITKQQENVKNEARKLKNLKEKYPFLGGMK